MKLSGNKSFSLILLGITILSAILTLIGILLPFQDNIIVTSLRIVFGSIFVLFLPGYYLSSILFLSNDIDILERIALSFALSISVIPLLVFYSNLIGIPISALSVYSITLIVILGSIFYRYFFQKTAGTQTKIEHQ